MNRDLLVSKEFEIDLQLFADGDDLDTTTAGDTAKPTTTSKVWSDDYVQSLREEAKTQRLAKKELEVAYQQKLELAKKETETAQMAVIEKANARLLKAEIKSLDGFDSKLLERLLDPKKIKIADDGEITGLKEAAEELAKEFPSLKIGTTRTATGSNPPLGDQTEYETLKKEHEAAQKSGNTALAINLKNRMFDIERKQGTQ